MGALVVSAAILPALAPTGAAGATFTVFEGPVPVANCHGDPLRETGIQGDVSAKDRTSGRSQLGYSCNLELIGHHQGQGAGWQNAWFDHCDYYDTKTGAATPPTPTGTGNGQTSPGTQVLDVSDPANPVLTANLDTPALDGPWESLKVNDKRKLLAGVGGFGSDGNGPFYFDVYDLSGGCAHPKKLSSAPVDTAVLGHEGNWSADGMTYYGSSLFTDTVSAIDVSNPANPLPITTFAPAANQQGVFTHGLSTSDDGNLLYTTDFASGASNGLIILDTSAIQSRSPLDKAPPAQVGHVGWTDGSAAQVPIPMDYNGHKFVLFVDEGSYGASRIIDVNDPANPVVVSKLKLQIHMPANQATAAADSTGDGQFTYTGHYCYVDREHDPTAAACGYFESGIRVFDIRDPYHPSEIAYFNPGEHGEKGGVLLGSEHSGSTSAPPNMTADWCTSQIRFYHDPDGYWYLWAQCQDAGFMTLRFTNNVYPLTPLAAPVTFTTGLGASPNTGAGHGSPAGGLVLIGLAAVAIVLLRVRVARSS